MQFVIHFFDVRKNLRNKISAFTQSEFAPAYSWKHTRLHQFVNSPVDSGFFYFGFKLPVKLHNVPVSKDALLFEMGLQFGDI